MIGVGQQSLGGHSGEHRGGARAFVFQLGGTGQAISAGVNLSGAIVIVATSIIAARSREQTADSAAPA